MVVDITLSATSQPLAMEHSSDCNPDSEVPLRSWDIEKGFPRPVSPTIPSPLHTRNPSWHLSLTLGKPFTAVELTYLAEQKALYYQSSNSSRTLHGSETSSINTSLRNDKDSLSQDLEDRVYTIDTDLPDKRSPKLLRNLRYIVLIMYRRIFTLALLANITIIALYVHWKWTYDFNKLSLAASVNLLVCTLMRSEIYINCMYGIICRIPLSWPLFIRKHAASVYHFGGLHSGCAIGCTIWLAYLSYSITFHSNGMIRHETQILTWILVGYLLLMCSFAYPRFRVLFHNQFELIHRFAGWLALAFVWAQSVLLARDLRSEGKTIGHALVRNPGLYCLIIVTLIIIYPWLHLRKVPVRTEKLSNHCVRMHFDYRSATAGSFQRVSTNPLFEWHSFAAISKPGTKGYSLVISKAGDWTSKIIANPPEKIWVRGIPSKATHSGSGQVLMCSQRME